MSDASNVCCDRCEWWKPDQEPRPERKAVFGECRRQSPRLQFSRYGDDVSSVWPPTKADDFCGEFRPAAEQAVMQFPAHAPLSEMG